MADGAEDPTTVREHICFLCKKPCLPRDKIKVFGRSSLEISALIARATKVDLSVYAASEREKAVICNSTCYKRLGKYQNVVRKLDAIVGEIQRDFHGRGLSRGKRLASEQNRPLDANKKIKLEDLLGTSSYARETLHQAPSTLQIGGKSNSCTEATVHVVYAAADSINTASNAGSSVSTFARPSAILAGDNTATKPGISVTCTFARPPGLAFAKGVNTAARPGICFTTAFTQLSSLLATATQPGISLTTFARPPPILATRNTATKPAVSATTFTRPPVLATTNSVNTASQSGISTTTTTTAAGPSPALAAANSVNTATQPGISLSTFARPPVLAAANSVNTVTKPGISLATLDRPTLISTAANNVSSATKPGISVTLLDRPPIPIAANSVNTASKPEVSVSTLDRPISTAAISVSTATKPGISVTALDRPPISTAANSVGTAIKPGISITALDRPPIPATANNVNITTKPVTSSCFSDPLGSFTTDQLFAVLPLQAQKPEEKQETRIRICVDYPSKPVRKELKSELHVLAKAMVDGNHQRIAGAALKIDGVKELVIEKVIKLMTVQVDELCSKHRPSMLRTSKNTNDEAKDFDYKKLCSEWKERAPLFHTFLTACAAIKNSKKKDSPECLPGVAVAGTVLLKQRNTQMNAGFAKILGFLIRSKSLEVRSCFLLLFIIFLIGKMVTIALQTKRLYICSFLRAIWGGRGVS